MVSKFSGLVTNIAGTGEITSALFNTLGPSLSVPLLCPFGISGNSNGLLYVADQGAGPGGNTIRGMFVSTQSPTIAPTISLAPTFSMSPSQSPSLAPVVPLYTTFTVAGTGVAGLTVDGTDAASGAINQPFGVFVDTMDSHLYFADNKNYKVRRINLSTRISTTIVGDGTTNTTQGATLGDGGRASAAQLYSVTGAASDTVGTFYTSDASQNRIRKIGLDNIITTYAGTGIANAAITAYASENGMPATAVDLSGPYIFTIDTAGHLYFPEFQGHKVRKIDFITHTMAVYGGNGLGNSGINGVMATSTSFSAPQAVFMDSTNVLYISTGNNRLRLIRPNGIIELVAGMCYLYSPK